MGEIQKHHQREVFSLQAIAQNVFAESRQQLAIERDRNQELLQMIESQEQMLEPQRKAQDNLALQVSPLQRELVKVCHSTMSSPSQPIEFNGTRNVTEMMQSIDAPAQLGLPCIFHYRRRLPFPMH